MNTSSDTQLTSSPTLVVVGYGNPTHGDDVIGCRVADRVQAHGFQNVEVRSVETLTPELSTTLAAADYAIFVDACAMKTTTVKVSPLDACGMETPGSSVPGLGHSYHPCSLLALTHSVYARHPQSWWVEVPAHEFRTGHSLSQEVDQNIQNAVQAIETLIHQCVNLPQSP